MPGGINKVKNDFILSLENPMIPLSDCTKDRGKSLV